MPEASSGCENPMPSRRETSTPASSASTSAVRTSSPSRAEAITPALGRDSDEATSATRWATSDSPPRRTATTSPTLRGTGSGSPAEPSAGRARAISSAKNGLPPEASAIRASTGRGSDEPSRSLITWWSAASERAPGTTRSTRSTRSSASDRPKPRGSSTGWTVRPQEQADGGRQPAGRVGERLLGGGIEPLDVVDRHEHRPFGGERRQGPDQGRGG